MIVAVRTMGGWGRTASVRPQTVRAWGLAALDPSHPNLGLRLGL
jgi:hypothetical protein